MRAPLLPPRGASGAGTSEGGAPPRAGDTQVRVLWVLMIIALALAATTVALAFRRWQAIPARYQTETVSRGQVTGALHLSAWLEPTSVVRVSSETTARVLSVEGAVGERVRRGQILARLDARAVEAEASGASAQVMAAKLGVRHAQVKLGQIVHMLEAGGGDEQAPAGPFGEEEPSTEVLQAAALEAEADLVNAVAKLRRQRAVARATRLSRERALVRAPIDGIITGRNVEAGETVAPGAPLFVVAADPTELSLVAQVTENDVSRVHPGPATFLVPALGGHRFDARVVSVDPAPTSDTPPFQYRVRLRARNDGLALRPGMTAVVALPLTSAADALRVPLRALHYHPGGAGDDAPGRAVWVVGVDGKPARVPVKAGVTDGELIEVRGAPHLAEGAAVITAAAPH